MSAVVIGSGMGNSCPSMTRRCPPLPRTYASRALADAVSAHRIATTNWAPHSLLGVSGSTASVVRSPEVAMEFRILGPLEVLAEHGPLPLGGPKQRALLAVLLVA